MLNNPLRRKPKKSGALQKQKQHQTNKQNVVIHLAPQVKPRTRAKGRTIAQGRQSQDNTRSVMVLSHAFPAYNEQNAGRNPMTTAAISAPSSTHVTQQERENAEFVRSIAQVADSLQSQSRQTEERLARLEKDARINFASNKSANTSNIEIAHDASADESIPITNDVSTPSVDTTAPPETPTTDSTITLPSASGSIDRGVGVPAENAGLAESPLKKKRGAPKYTEEQRIQAAKEKEANELAIKDFKATLRNANLIAAIENGTKKMSPAEKKAHDELNLLRPEGSVSGDSVSTIIDNSTGSAPPNPLKRIPSVSSSGGSGHRSISSASTLLHRSFANHAMLNNPFYRDRQRVDEENSQSTEFM